jgi:hypothetical protein
MRARRITQCTLRDLGFDWVVLRCAQDDIGFGRCPHFYILMIAIARLRLALPSPNKRKADG